MRARRLWGPTPFALLPIHSLAPQAGKFSQLITLFPIAGGGMYVKNDAVRFGPAAVPFNTSLDASGLGGSFAQQYYQIYGSNRSALAGVYRPTSSLTFEGRPATGVAAIMEAVSRMPAGKQELTTLDVQPVSADAVVALVTGAWGGSHVTSGAFC
jgi:hypothetical protein